MANDKTLFEVIENERKAVKKYKPELLEMPEFITKNLKYDFFEWQKSALENFLIFDRMPELDDFPDLKNKPTHLLFNMATGAGKTMMMAALILYYFEKGYRHFLFFVNQNNIVDKTENNFIDPAHAKFLFTEKILQGDTVIPIRKVEMFSPHSDGIEIKFTSIQKLYNDIHTERENQTTLADLHKLNLVMLGDEAHHLNAQTKGKKQDELDLEVELKANAGNAEIERKGWEHMVLELLLNKNGNPGQNVLLEFTATLPENADVQQKYADKIITKFGLKEFLQKGYTKEINLVSSTLNKKERVLHALLFAWYRHQIALKYGIANFKPVMLFRSKTIDESKADYSAFLNWAENVQADDFEFLDTFSGSLNNSDNANEQGKTRTEQALKFMQENGFEFAHLANWVKQNYQKHNVIITNSETNKNKTEKTDSETEKLLNNLEAADNPIRAIFTVDRLTEGWDVLNLFDIVRLYEGQNGGGSNKKSGKTAAATVSEKQLIGRGVRYFPFAFEGKQPNKRKFDNDMQHELRILEELFYYTHDEQSRYISELKNELRKDGYLPEKDDDKVLATFKLKSEFADNKDFRELLIWANKKIPNPNAKSNNADSLQANPQTLSFQVHGNQLLQETQFTADENDETARQIGTQNNFTQTIKMSEMERHIFNKALHIKGKNSQSLFHFNRLQSKLNIQNRNELQNNLLKDWQIEFLGLGQDKQVRPDDKLAGCLKILEMVEKHLNESDMPFIGTKEFTPKKLWEIFGTPKQKWVKKDDVKTAIATQNDWYVMDNFAGTSLEEALIQFISERLGNLKSQYDVHLIRNEEVFKLNNFSDGEGFMPDFILLLKNKQKSSSNGVDDFLHYQIFIEPKGGHLVENDEWKNAFLEAITVEYGKNKILQKDTPHYRLIGLPFFTDNEKNPKEYEQFTKSFPLGPASLEK
ncbi:DEAD/DEAH box helicase family protein [Haemophilus influenzae]|uniref:DEAD/DEAH box helicase family protein n=1 Tax=Haemophilus influenzae TaxID=727 RepID=UPI000666645B|nr:DEAD/DEAH box helicase family protein [Haemophilus influenzae]KMZ18318.1 type III restriction-modification system HindVIP enzyme res [Haemophilus influenzae]PRJ53094.1 Type III restriction enzyme, res subunit [Haemophilus influenzae]PRK85573.1 Type III restriction enzyme, res subunit [Haemophilus influenzae]PRK90318.1 Type III restriction enzyme, res subunit [Haemophilus influenzae]PRL41063.1 Type III restriction enzyme, res subunit [Haemophilus influenzae]